jgi:hypothetical protein
MAQDGGGVFAVASGKRGRGTVLVDEQVYRRTLGHVGRGLADGADARRGRSKILYSLWKRINGEEFAALNNAHGSIDVVWWQPYHGRLSRSQM